jgi:hypothetical protein
MLIEMAPPDYSKGMVYKIVQRDGRGECYIGSTTNIVQRRAQHKAACNNSGDTQHNENKYQHMRQTGGFENWCVVPVEVYPCNSKTELELRERHWIETLTPLLNINKPAGIAAAGGLAEYKAQYYIDHKAEIKAHQAQYYIDHGAEIGAQHYIDNKTKINAQHAQYRIDHEAEISAQRAQYRIDNKTKIKARGAQYYIDNKAEISARQAQYRIDNKVAINARRTQKRTLERAARAEVISPQQAAQ